MEEFVVERGEDEEDGERKEEGGKQKKTKTKKNYKKQTPKPALVAPPIKLDEDRDYNFTGTLETFPKVIELNVGGQYYCTSIETLRRFPQSMLGLMFSGRYPTAKDADGKYFIDRDGPAFGVILNFLRTDRVFLGNVEPSLVYAEAEYYRLPLVPEWEVGVELQTQVQLDLEGEKSIVSMLRKATLSPWYTFAQQTIHDNMPKLVSVLSRGSQQNGSFGASLALYQNEKKKNTLSTSWKTEGPESVVSWFDLILYLEKVAQPLVEIWCHYLKREGFVSIAYRKKTHPVLHWCINLEWNTTPIEYEGKNEVHHIHNT